MEGQLRRRVKRWRSRVEESRGGSRDSGWTEKKEHERRECWGQQRTREWQQSEEEARGGGLV
jgi:hypothetical protein